MKRLYTITGMTCSSCKAKVTEALETLSNVTDAEVNLENNTATLTMREEVSLSELQAALSEKYQINPATETVLYDKALQTGFNSNEQTKFQQLKPLFIILLYITSTSILLHHKTWNIEAIMLDFMGLFYVVFSFFKMLDLKGFPDSFSMYDPLAKRLPVYGKLYPFIETLLGLMFLFRFEIPVALILTIIVLGITTIGVSKTLLDKKAIRCACLGTALKLPMTEATFIENAIMLVMAIFMLLKPIPW